MFWAKTLRKGCFVVCVGKTLGKAPSALFSRLLFPAAWQKVKIFAMCFCTTHEKGMITVSSIVTVKSLLCANLTQKTHGNTHGKAIGATCQHMAKALLCSVVPLLCLLPTRQRGF
jgi:hypothetical protein